MSELEKACRERDLYRRLLELGAQTELEPFLRDALALIVEVTGARQGYLELGEPGMDADDRWSLAHGFSEAEVGNVRRAISSGIIAEALATGKTIETPSALADPRFAERGSVRAARIEAVLCAPIGDGPPVGVLYLQGGRGAGAFAPEDRDKTEVFARHLGPFVDRLLSRTRAAPDPIARHRERLRLEGVVGHSEALAALLDQVALVAPLDITVLLTGQSGTGKSQIARVIHDSGPRAGAAFVELNCAAIPEALIESELFGALPGAHSTATRRIEGKVAAAARGTLLLDEVGDLSPPAQAKLLHLLQTKQYYPLGATKPEPADVRVIAATNVDLQQAVAERRFRDDLLYRLQVMPIRVPALAERGDDVLPLAQHFCKVACAHHKLARVELSAGALRALQSADWPGNVRQLAHTVEAGAVRAAGAGALRVETAHLFPQAPAVAAAGHPPTFQEATRRFQADLLRDALTDLDWNVSQVARRLDLTRTHVYNLIRAFGLERRPR